MSEERGASLSPTSLAEDFHDHLDACEKCRNNPFDLCPVGSGLLSDSGRVRANAEQHLDPDVTGESETKADEKTRQDIRRAALEDALACVGTEGHCETFGDLLDEIRDRISQLINDNEPQRERDLGAEIAVRVSMASMGLKVPETGTVHVFGVNNPAFEAMANITHSSLAMMQRAVADSTDPVACVAQGRIETAFETLTAALELLGYDPLDEKGTVKDDADTGNDS